MSHTTQTRAHTTTIGQYLLDRLHSLGVNHIFGVPGDYVLRLDKLIEQDKNIAFINSTRENTAGYMADAYARLNGIGVACVTYGVGISICNSMAQAYVENSPVVFISGAASSEDVMRSHQLHHLINKSFTAIRDRTQLELFSLITADQAVLDDPQTAAADIDRVLKTCFQQKKPVYIELPKNRVDQQITVDNLSDLIIKQPESDQATLHEALAEIERMLKVAKKPIIWAGHEIQRHQLAPQLLQFAEKFQIPIVTSLLGKTVISERHPLFCGVYQGALSLPEVRDFVESCDYAFVLGVMINDVDTGAFTAKVDINKRVLATAANVNILHHHYDNINFRDFMYALAALKPDKPFQHTPPKRTFPQFNPKKDRKITTAQLFAGIQAHLKPEHILLSDVGDCLFGSADLILEQNSYLACAYFASLGFATPGAVGAAIALPERRIIALVGDGAFQMTCMELSTAVRYDADPIIIVFNNHGYTTERPIIEGAYNDIVDWNYYELPKVLTKGVGCRVTNEDELDQALKQAMENRGQFYLIEVELDKTDYSPAMKRFAALFGKR